MLHITKGVGVQRAEEVECILGEANVLQCCEKELLRDGWEGGSEVQEYAGAPWLCERGDHGGSINLEEVGEYGAAAKESLLARKDPVG